MKLLALDIGNTNITCGFFINGKLKARLSLPTAEEKSYARLKLLADKYNAERALICSVVPAATRKAEAALKRSNIKKTAVLGKEIKIPIKNLYRRPKQVGHDRLVNALAASLLYGYPAIVVDFGTAITFDVISKNREYEGGMIIPGFGISLDVLSERTALLPKVKLNKPPKSLIGKDTKESILSGIIYGFSTLADGVISRLRKQLKENSVAIGTGGNIAIIKPYCRSIKIFDPDLTLKGISLIHKLSCK